MSYDYKVFTKEMKRDYKILVPNMLPIHFKVLDKMLKDNGFNIEFLENDVDDIIEEGLRYANNDICYPAMIVIGQFISALKSGKYDLNKTAVLMTQTGGGCRASNYIHLIRKALENSGFKDVPAIGLSVSGIENHPGLKLSPTLIIKALYGILYSDLIMYLYNKVKPYEVNKNETDMVLDKEIRYLNDSLTITNCFKVSKIAKHIVNSFNEISINKTEKIKVGIVGEIYMKYSRMGNNHLEEFLINENAEVVQSGLLDFINYCLINSIVDNKLYNKSKFKAIISKYAYKFILRQQSKINNIIQSHSKFDAPESFEKVRKMADEYIGYGVKMGEGWLLVSNMIELIKQGANNIICAEPFGCLPNHIVGRGAIRKIMDKHPNANIVVIDYDPSQSKINQENRIKLMLSNANLNIYL
ncbi:2-hydroxyglutaryl-CoA dehydratase [Clostridium tertium]|uniref:2-hydroxyglutaryl-CoA dehydratase, D-component n=1 Tax=Clostridium tertium TaxID=1559 RepID=A0A6N2YJ42_9CLOT